MQCEDDFWTYKEDNGEVVCTNDPDKINTSETRDKEKQMIMIAAAGTAAVCAILLGIFIWVKCRNGNNPCSKKKPKRGRKGKRKRKKGGKKGPLKDG